jgi:hypothetical protein
MPEFAEAADAPSDKFCQPARQKSLVILARASKFAVTGSQAAEPICLTLISEVTAGWRVACTIRISREMPLWKPTTVPEDASINA